MFDTVLIAGLGLMGGSMAKTIKARTLSRVLGWNRTRATAEQARADGTIDAVATEALYKEADLVIIGLYPQATVDWLLENMPKMKKGCVVVDMVGVNNRNLGSFVTDVENSFRIARQLREATHGPASPLLVSESGISDPETICRLRAAGFRGFLIGETFMKTATPGETLKKFIQDSLLIDN